VTNASVEVIKMSDGSDVTSSVTSGSPSVSGQTITLPMLQSLVAGQSYRVNIQYNKDGNTIIDYVFMDCTE